jgi:uncharacterized protein
MATGGAMTSNDERLIGPDLVLLLLRAPGTDPSTRDRVNGITRLEKLLFLADQESELPGKIDEALQFKAYNYGPYSKQVYEAVDLLEEANLLSEEKAIEGKTLDAMEGAYVDVDDVEGVERRFFLTDEGRAVADLLASQHPEMSRLLANIKRKFGRLPLRQLIEYVYRRYPKYAEESLIRDQFIRW